MARVENLVEKVEKRLGLERVGNIFRDNFKTDYSPKLLKVFEKINAVFVVFC